MNHQKRRPEAESRLVKIAVILFTLISLGTVSCEKAKGLCEKTEELVYALQHLAGAINHPERQKSPQQSPPGVTAGSEQGGADKAAGLGGSTKAAE